jgi:flagellar biosynthesis/type III secretory pathway protein FliH
MDGMLFEPTIIFARGMPLPSDGGSAGILYIEDFDAPPIDPVLVAEEPAPEVPAQRFSLEEFTTAQAAAHASGMAAGLAQALAEQTVVQAQLRAAALASIGDALAAGADERAAVAHGMAEELTQCVAAVLLAALPACAALHARMEIAALLEVVLPPLKREPSLQIQVHPDLLADVEADLAPFRAQYAGALSVSGTAGLAVPDVLVRWSAGEARRDVGGLWQALRQALSTVALPDLSVLVAAWKGDGNGQ